MATKYPQYRVTQWIDTSEEAMNKPQATFLFGVQIMPAKGEKWMHCCRDTEPLIFETAAQASAAIDELKREQHAEA